MPSLLRIEDRGAVRLITIDREPKLNVLSRPLVAELQAESLRAAGDGAVRAVVLTGAGTKAFCAGADLKERTGWTHADVRAWLIELHSALRAIERCPKPWIAAVNGLALGGGCEVALACDLRVMDPSAQIGLTETRIGIIPGGGGTVRLSRLVGLGRARELILTARRASAVEAVQMGMANKLSAPGDSVNAAIELARQIAENAPVAVAAAKAALEEAWDLPIDEALAAERRHYELPLASQDRDEGLRAFAEKRPPQWRGR